MLDLTKEDKDMLDVVPNSIKYVELSCGKFFVKVCSEEEILGKLVINKVINMLGIEGNSCYYLKEDNLLLDRCYDKNILYASNVGMNNTTLDNVYRCILYQKDKKNIFINDKDIMFEIYKMYFLDVLFGNSKRTNYSYGFNIEKDGRASLVILDFLSLFTTSYCDIKAEFNNLITSVDNEVIKIINDIIAIFTPKKIKLIIDDIEKEYDCKFLCKNEFYLKYFRNYLIIANLLLFEKVICRRKILSK